MTERSLDPVVETVVGPRLRSLEGLTVNRVWPTARRRLIGPFIFLDHMQPIGLPAGRGFDVPPHPHIGLATVTYLFEGELMHADSLGIRQPIRPGDLNWMTAGRGIAHSERSTDSERSRPSRLHGMQAWVALPRAVEQQPPRFEHVGADALPRFAVDDARLTLIAGAAFGRSAPVATASPLFYFEARIESGGVLELPADLGERGVYLVEGEIEIDGEPYGAGRMLVLKASRSCRIEARANTRLMLLGGEPLDGERLIWWNFVASDAASIEAAKADWSAGRFPAVPGDPELMPLPAA
jgi:redox-sensitive bicupin YhaK (pirin superfamily)